MPLLQLSTATDGSEESDLNDGGAGGPVHGEPNSRKLVQSPT